MHGQKHIIMSLWHGLAFIVDQKWKNRINKLRKVDEKIIQLARSRTKRQKETDGKDGFKSSSGSD